MPQNGHCAYTPFDFVEFKKGFIVKHAILLALATASLAACQPSDAPKPKADAPTPTTPVEVTGPVFLSADNATQIADNTVASANWEALDGAVFFDTSLIGEQGAITDETVAVAMTGEKANAYRIFEDRGVLAGQTVNVTMSVSGAEGTSASFLLARHCGSTPYEGARVNVELTPEPQDVTLSKTFEQDHACYRVQVSNVKDATDGAVAVWSIN